MPAACPPLQPRIHLKSLSTIVSELELSRAPCEGRHAPCGSRAGEGAWQVMAGVPVVTWHRANLTDSSCTAVPRARQPHPPRGLCRGCCELWGSPPAPPSPGLFLPVPLALVPQPGPQSQQLSWRPRSRLPSPPSGLGPVSRPRLPASSLPELSGRLVCHPSPWDGDCQGDPQHPLPLSSLVKEPVPRTLAGIVTA